jgi:hypothetical protein
VNAEETLVTDRKDAGVLAVDIGLAQPPCKVNVRILSEASSAHSQR